MKELSIEEKARRYDEAIKRVEDIKIGKCETRFMFTEGLFEHIFPALKESEDERIRKAIINVFASHKDYEVFFGVSVEDILAWLEAQGEQKPADKVEPKFHEGDWVVYCNDDVDFITGVEEFGYRINNGGYIPFMCASDVRLWAIQDAKDGDVLAVEPIEGYLSSFVAIYKKQNKEDFDSYCFVGFDGKFYDGENGHSAENIHPATKEQRDTLMKAMADAGYTFDFEKN